MNTEKPVYRTAVDADREAIRRFHALTELWPDGEGELGEEFMEDDVKYVDRRGKNQRDYFALMFRETNDGYEPHFLSMGALFYILPDGLQVTAE